MGEFGQDVTGALGDFFGGGASGHLAANPFSVFDVDRGLRGDFLREKSVSGGCGDTPCGSVWLVEETAIFEVGHHITDGGGAERFFAPLGNRARRYRLA